MSAQALTGYVVCLTAIIVNLHCVTPSPPQAQVPRDARVTLHTASDAVTVAVEVADDEPAREKGLMFRKTMPVDRGMLFIFPDEVPRAFWMKNTYLPLDIIFISGARQVVGVVDHAEPLTTTPRQVAAPSRYVLEVNAGLAKRWGVGPDTIITFAGLPPARP